MDKQDSLADRMAQRLAAGPPRVPRLPGAPVDWRLALALAAVIALGPLATITGAAIIERSARAEAERLTAQAAPRLKAEASARAARAVLREAVRQPGDRKSVV